MIVRLSTLLPAACLTILAGCASAPATQTPASLDAAAATEQAPIIARSAEEKPKAGSDMHCTSYRPTGSHRKITRCISKEQQLLERDAARRTIGSKQGPSVSAPTDF